GENKQCIMLMAPSAFQATSVERLQVHKACPVVLLGLVEKISAGPLRESSRRALWEMAPTFHQWTSWLEKMALVGTLAKKR
ncbi:hypothetical protein M3P21_22445, partial [Ruegeria sp. 2012CJ41-6]